MLWMNVANAAAFLGTPVRARTVLGGAVGFIGLCLLFRPELAAFDLSSERTGALLVSIIASYSASLGNILSARNQKAGMSVVASNGLAMTYGGAMTLAFALARGHALVFDPSAPYVISLAFLVLFGSIVAFGSYLKLLGRIGPDRAAYAMIVFPLVALGVSTLFEGYVWTPLAGLGAALILAGNLVVLGRAVR
jgi:drug/metabolite transporter (DMT)-like permease